MHDIEPYFGWRHKYIASEDKDSPFYGQQYDEFKFSQKIYNYFIHPQWDDFGSPSLYAKVIYVDYDKQFALIELIGEWNDCLNNDIMLLKENILDVLLDKRVSKICLLCDNVLNFHASDDCYYEALHEDLMEQNGWLSLINLREHVIDEMETVNIHHYIQLDEALMDVLWQGKKPDHIILEIEQILNSMNKQIYY